MRILKAGATIAVIVIAIAALRLLPIGPWITDLQNYVRSAGAAGYVIYALAYGLLALFPLGSVLTIGAGAIFGVVGGTIVVAIGATLAATLAFVLARTVLRRKIEALALEHRAFRAVDEAVARDGARIVFLVRLAAIFPFTLVNYLFGLTSIPLSRYVAATAIGILPGTIAFVWLGAAGAAAATQERTRLIVTVTGALIALVVSVIVGRIATKAIRRAGAEGPAGDML